MRPYFIVGVFVLVVGVVGVLEYGSRKGGDKVDSQAAARQLATDFAGKATVRPDATTGGAGDAGTAGTQPAESDKSSKIVKHSIVLGEGRGGFRLNSLVLSDDAMAMLDELVSSMTEEDLTSAHFEIEGHTDSLGAKDVNARVGLARAIAVKMYLCSQFEIEPRHIKVVSYGSEKPIADNASQEGRALNRRVVIKVIE